MAHLKLWLDVSIVVLELLTALRRSLYHADLLGFLVEKGICVLVCLNLSDVLI